MTDEWELRDLAKELASLYRELGEAHFTRGTPPEVQVTKPTFGPKDPAPMHLMSLDEELCARLFEMVRECANHIQPTLVLHHHGQRLAAWVAWNAQAVADLDVAPDLADEMQDQARRIRLKLRGPGVPQARHAAAVSDRWGTAAELAPIVTAVVGRSITNKKITEAGRAQKFQKRTAPDGTSTYQLAAMVDHFK